MKGKIFFLLILSTAKIVAMQPRQWIRDAHASMIQENTRALFNLLQKVQKIPLNVNEQGKKEIDRLIEDGINVNAQNAAGYTPLYLATLHKLIAHIELLLKKGANPNIKNNYGSSPLAAAASSNNVTITQLLLTAGANPNLRLVNNSTALIIAVRFADGKNNYNQETIQLLIDANANLDLQNDAQETALNIAVTNGNLVLAKKLLEAGADPNIEDANGNSALLLAKDNQELWEYIFEFKRLRRLKQMGRN